MPSNLILMLSVGDRPWKEKGFATFQCYAKKIGCDAILITEIPGMAEFPLPEMPDRPGRPNKRAYACKSYLPWKYISNGYDRVLMVDDSCAVSPSAPNIFELVPIGSVGYTGTSAAHAESSFQSIRKFQEKILEDYIDFDAKDYANSGVILYGRDALERMSLDEIIRSSDLLYAKYPHQTLLYYLLKRHKIPLYRMPKSFNTGPGIGVGEDGARKLEEFSTFLEANNVFISHVTGGFGSQRRVVAEHVADSFLRSWGEAGITPGAV